MLAKRHLPAVALTAVSLFLAGTALAEQRHLGFTRLARHEKDMDVVQVPPCRSKGKVNEIKFRVTKGNVEIEKLWVRFENGEVEYLEVKKRFEEGGESRWLDLRGRKRCVDKIGLIGDTEGSIDQARIDFYGR